MEFCRDRCFRTFLTVLWKNPQHDCQKRGGAPPGGEGRLNKKKMIWYGGASQSMKRWDVEISPWVQFHLHNPAVLFVTKANWVKRVARLETKFYFSKMNWAINLIAKPSSQSSINRNPHHLAPGSWNPRMLPVLDHLHHWKYLKLLKIFYKIEQLGSNWGLVIISADFLLPKLTLVWQMW